MTGWQVAALAVPVGAVAVVFAVAALVRLARSAMAPAADGEPGEDRFAEQPVPLMPLFAAASTLAIVLGAGWILIYSGSWSPA